AWLSDVLCRAVTGDGMVRRALWTNDDLSVLAFLRVVVLNGIHLGALRGDLSERLLSVECERITPARRRSSRTVETLSPDEHAEVLGALLDLVGKVLAELPGVHLDELPRMADFALLLEAIDRITLRETGSPGTGLARYLAQAGQLAELVVEADPFTAAVR